MSISSRREFFGLVGAGALWFIGDVSRASAATQLDGKPCKVAGRTRTLGDVTYVCRKRNGALRWKKKDVPVAPVTLRVLDSGALELGATKLVDVALPTGSTKGVVLTRTQDGVTALHVSCTHQGFPVERRGQVLECELHGSQFDPKTGEVVTGPASRPLPRYTAVEQDGAIFVTI